jgi:hypothetical protein
MTGHDDRDLQELLIRRAATNSHGRFEFIIAVCDDESRKSEILTSIETDLQKRGPARLTRLRIPAPGEAGPVSGELEPVLVREVRLLVESIPQDRRGALSIDGLDAHVGPDGEPSTSMIGNMNFHRELFDSACPMPMILWMAPTTYPAFATHAGDLWHWRTLSVFFDEESPVAKP